MEIVGATAEGGRDYVQDEVRPATDREGALGYERYIAWSTGMCGAILLHLHRSRQSRRVAAPTDTSPTWSTHACQKKGPQFPRTLFPYHHPSRVDWLGGF